MDSMIGKDLVSIMADPFLTVAVSIGNSSTRGILDQLKNVDSARVLVMPQGKTMKELRSKARWIVELCKKNGFGYTPRLHIELFGNRRGT